MYPNLTGLGIHDPKQIERYTLRQEAHKDVLKIYFHKQKGELFAKSVKFKYPRQIKNVLVDGGSHQYREVTEINRNLTLIIDELNTITRPAKLQEMDLKEKILADLRHLEKVVSSKIHEIETDLEKLK
jgi:tRNA splicing ligase